PALATSDPDVVAPLVRKANPQDEEDALACVLFPYVRTLLVQDREQAFKWIDANLSGYTRHTIVSELATTFMNSDTELALECGNHFENYGMFCFFPVTAPTDPGDAAKSG